MWYAMFWWLRNQVQLHDVYFHYRGIINASCHTLTVYDIYVDNYYLPVLLIHTGEWTVSPVEYCNCCDYSAIHGLWNSPGVLRTFNVCAGITEASQACTCFRGLEVNKI